MNKKVLIYLVSPLLVAVIASGILHYAITNYFIGQAKEEILNILLSNRGFHQYIQKVMHPALFDAINDGLISKDFYNPKLLSSTYIVRTMHGLYNEERAKDGLIPVYYKMAANNPRNPINKADELEAKLIRLFNENQDGKIRDYQEIMRIDGKKYLYYAVPFLKNEERCMRCHGDPEKAPPGLRRLYPQEGGFHEKVGEIRAIESMRMPVDEQGYMALMVTGSAGSGLFVIIVLFFFNTGLKQMVQNQTKHLKAEIKEREKAEEAIACEKERLAVTLRSIGDGVITTDISGHITSINKVAEEITGWSDKEANGRQLAEVFNIINENTREACENPVSKVINTGLIVGLANHTALIRKDGTEIILADSAAPIRDSKSVTIGVVLVFRDITAQYRMEQEMQRMQKLESLGLLAGGLAHDFNNLLTSIMGNVSLSKMLIGAENKAYSRLSEAEHAAQRAADLTHQLLTFSKGGAPIKRIASIPDIVREGVNFALSGSNVKCIYSIPTHLWSVEVDKGQMNQVFSNLALNAVQAMPDGGTVRIYFQNTSIAEEEIAKLRGGHYVRITFTDEGIGIPDENIGKIFDPYFTTKKTGNGLGLATVFSILKRHEGSISVKSVTGVGTTFTIHIPALFDTVNPEHDASGGIKQGRGKILVMDDEELVRNVSGYILTSLGYEVDVAKDGKAAIEMFKREAEKGKPFDLVIMDLTIPGGLGGKDAALQLHEIAPDAKIIVSSGYSVDPIMSDYKKYGFCGVINKPYNAIQVSEIISRILKS
ncbi:MAG: DUF3365 domain-containing protein [Candidatus Riflebacteria bacterium]|nr:DUF3365 domain-containing protein [Candidatus Riflebacteria bacterium]